MKTRCKTTGALGCCLGDLNTVIREEEGVKEAQGFEEEKEEM